MAGEGGMDKTHTILAICGTGNACGLKSGVTIVNSYYALVIDHQMRIIISGMNSNI